MPSVPSAHSGPPGPRGKTCWQSLLQQQPLQNSYSGKTPLRKQSPDQQCRCGATTPALGQSREQDMAALGSGGYDKEKNC